MVAGPWRPRSPTPHLPPPSGRHRRARVVRLAAQVSALAALALLAAACADPVTDPMAAAGRDGEAADPDAEPDRGAPSDDLGAGPHNLLSEELRGAPDGCGAEVEAATVGTIAAQLDDLARGDDAAALSRATSAFRSGTDAAAFRDLIEDSSPLLVQDATAVLLRCSRQGPGTVEALVEVTTADRVSALFVYRLRLDDQRWAIDAAVRLTPPPATA